jgi:large subunit ribosomal protein L19
VRRAKLYYLRDRVGKRARVRERRYTGPEETVLPGLLHEPDRSEIGQQEPAESESARPAEDVVDAAVVDAEGVAAAEQQADRSGSDRQNGSGDASPEGESGAGEVEPAGEQKATAADQADSPPEAGVPDAGDTAA